MNHYEAAKSYAVERYLLREMSEVEVEEFETHYFSCPVCAEELKLDMLMKEKAPAARAEAQAPVRRFPGRWTAWWRQPAFAAPAFAALALAVFSGYEVRELVRLNRPHEVLAYTLQSEGVRGTSLVMVPAKQRSLELSVDLPDGSYPMYQWELYDVTGRLKFSVASHRPLAGQPLTVSLPAGLDAGEYVLNVFGLRGSERGPDSEYRFKAVQSQPSQ